MCLVRRERRTYASCDAAEIFDNLRQCIGIDHEVEENVNVGCFGFVQWSKELELSKGEESGARVLGDGLTRINRSRSS